MSTADQIMQSLLKKKPSTLAAFLADREWATELDYYEDLGGEDRDAARGGEDRDPVSEGEDRDPVSEDRDPVGEDQDPVSEHKDPESEGENPVSRDRDPVNDDRDPASEGEDKDPVSVDCDPVSEDRDPVNGVEDKDPVSEGEDEDHTSVDRYPVSEDRDPVSEGEDKGDKDRVSVDHNPVSEDKDLVSESEDKDPLSVDLDPVREGTNRDPVNGNADIDFVSKVTERETVIQCENRKIVNQDEDRDTTSQDEDKVPVCQNADRNSVTQHEDRDTVNLGKDRNGDSLIDGGDSVIQSGHRDNVCQVEKRDTDTEREDRNNKSEHDETDCNSQDKIRDTVSEHTDSDCIEISDNDIVSNSYSSDSSIVSKIKEKYTKIKLEDRNMSKRKFVILSCQSEIMKEKYDSMSNESSKTFEVEDQSENGDKSRKRIKRKQARKPDFGNTTGSELSDSSECSEVSEKRTKHTKRVHKRKYYSESSESLTMSATSKKRENNVTCKSKKYDWICERFPGQKKQKTTIKTGHTSSEAHSQSSSKDDLSQSASRDTLSQRYFERCETKIPKSARKRDVNNHKIYVRKLVNSQYTYRGKKKKSETDWGQVHACRFCKKIRTNFAKHLRRHKTEHEVKVILKASKDMGSRHKEVRAMWDCLRNEGDHLHNMAVIEEGAGEMIIGRRHHDSLDISLYGPCPGCKVWIKLDKTLYRHQHICPALVTGEADNRDFTLKELRIKAMQVSGQISSSASLLLQNEVYPIMTNDEITKIAKSDPLIVSLGNLWLLKNSGNRLKRKYYTSSRMRGAARLLMNVRNLTDKQEGFREFLKPENFDNIIKATLLTASPDMDDEEDLKAPSTALKLGYDIKRLVGAKWGFALRNNESADAVDCKDFLKLMKFEWSVKVSKVALVTLQVRRFNAEKALPVPEDLLKLQNHVKRELKKFNLSNYSFSTYRRAEVLAQTRLLMFNKQRSGEVEVISIKDFMRRMTGMSQLDSAMRADMSPLEVKLLETQDVMEVRGKYGRGVPVIVPQDLREVLQYLVNAEVREQTGVLPTNKYLFPNRSIGVIRAYDSLKMMCREVTLQKPDKLTSVNLRKYTATISQVFDLNSQQQQWLANHLGHSMDIHKIHYRQTSGLIERVDMAKLMLMQELNITAKYAGKKLQDIQLPELVFGGDDADAAAVQMSDERQNGETGVSLDQVLVEEEDEGYQPNLLKDDSYDEYNFEDDDDDGAQKKMRKKGASTRVKWTNDEIAELKLLFKENLESRQTPGRQQIETVKLASKTNKGILHKRHWETIKKKVWNLIQKRKY